MNAISAHRGSGVKLALAMPEANDLRSFMALVAQAEREAISRRMKEAPALVPDDWLQRM